MDVGDDLKVRPEVFVHFGAHAVACVKLSLQLLEIDGGLTAGHNGWAKFVFLLVCFAHLRAMLLILWWWSLFRPFLWLFRLVFLTCCFSRPTLEAFLT